ncbi:sugar ABC transporter permease, partial [Rhizobiaceae sp. 2RAB30]
MSTTTAGGARAARSRTWTKLADAASRWAFMAPSAIILAAMLAYPIFYTIEISFSRFDLMTFSAVEW